MFVSIGARSSVAQQGWSEETRQAAFEWAAAAHGS